MIFLEAWQQQSPSNQQGQYRSRDHQTPARRELQYPTSNAPTLPHVQNYPAQRPTQIQQNMSSRNSTRYPSGPGPSNQPILSPNRPNVPNLVKTRPSMGRPPRPIGPHQNYTDTTSSLGGRSRPIGPSEIRPSIGRSRPPGPTPNYADARPIGRSRPQVPPQSYTETRPSLGRSRPLGPQQTYAANRPVANLQTGPNNVNVTSSQNQNYMARADPSSRVPPNLAQYSNSSQNYNTVNNSNYNLGASENLQTYPSPRQKPPVPQYRGPSYSGKPPDNANRGPNMGVPPRRLPPPNQYTEPTSSQYNYPSPSSAQYKQSTVENYANSQSSDSGLFIPQNKPYYPKTNALSNYPSSNFPDTQSTIVQSQQQVLQQSYPTSSYPPDRGGGGDSLSQQQHQKFSVAPPSYPMGSDGGVGNFIQPQVVQNPALQQFGSGGGDYMQQVNLNTSSKNSIIRI